MLSQVTAKNIRDVFETQCTTTTTTTTNNNNDNNDNNVFCF